MPNPMQPALELIDIDKRFGPVHANRSINLRVDAASVHGVVGENECAAFYVAAKDGAGQLVANLGDCADIAIGIKHWRGIVLAEVLTQAQTVNDCIFKINDFVLNILQEGLHPRLISGSSLT